MSTSAEQITDLIGGYTNLKSYFEGQRDDWDSRVAAKEAQVDAFVAGAKNALTMPRRGVFDPSVVHSKTSLSPVADPAAGSQSEWQVVPMLPTGVRVSGDETKKAVLQLNHAFSSPPGFYENPQYSADTSRSMLNFVLASAELTSAEINARLAELGTNLANISSSSSITDVREIPIIRPAGKSGFLKLWVRFRNIDASGTGAAPQDITTRGGNTTFQLDCVNVYSL